MVHYPTRAESIREDPKLLDSGKIPRIPSSYVQRDWEIFEGRHDIVIVVHELEEDDENHNCDDMGCGWDHVLYRIKK